MDEKTRDLRRRNKELYKRNTLSPFESRGLGRKNKPADTFPHKRCEHVTGGHTITFRKRRKDNTTYLVSIVKGGLRCPKQAIAKNKCLEHLG